MKTVISINALYKFRKKWRIKKAYQVVDLMNKVINSDKFKQKILDFDFSDRRHRHDPNGEFREINDNNEIYEILMKGNEQNSKEGDDYKWKLNIKLGKFLPQVGRREGDLIITQNWFFKRNNNQHELAAHWFHEYSHVLGFHHDYKRTEIRDHSVPYALGTIVEDLIKNHNL